VTPRKRPTQEVRNTLPDTGTYVFDQGRHDERERLAAMEELWDHGTKRAIEALGIAPGWRCLEVGAGAGSVARWLADAVRPGGEVVATDVSTIHLDDVERPNLEVREHDILVDPLPEGNFDLIHARLLVEHLGTGALARMLPALAPGGWLVLEDLDWNGAAGYPEDEPVRVALDALAGFMSRSGYDPYFGRKLVHELERVGLEDVAAEGRLGVYRGASPAADFLGLSLESVGGAMVEAGLVTRDELERGLASLDDPDSVFLSASMIAAQGRRPSP
jgi:SAM-dependent methyltransferase